MFRKYNCTGLKGLFVTLTVVSIALLSGCGNMERSPLASSSADPMQEEIFDAPNTVPVGVVSSPDALRAEKRAVSGQIDSDDSTTTKKGKGGSFSGKFETSRFVLDD